MGVLESPHALQKLVICQYAKCAMAILLAFDFEISAIPLMLIKVFFRVY